MTKRIIFDNFNQPIRNSDGQPVIVDIPDDIIAYGKTSKVSISTDQNGETIATPDETSNITITPSNDRIITNIAKGTGNEINFNDGANYDNSQVSNTQANLNGQIKPTFSELPEGIGFDSLEYQRAGIENNEDYSHNDDNFFDIENLDAVKVHNTNRNEQKLDNDEATVSLESKPNILHNFSTATYNIELFLLTVDDYLNFADNPAYKIEDKPGRLMIKSGGGNYNNRNKYFDLDYFIEDLEIESIIAPGADNGGSLNTAINFKIIEPYGMTFLNNLAAASGDFGIENHIDMPYLLKVFMTGYDSNGRIMSNKYKGQLTRYIPIKFIEMKFGVTEKGTAYDITAIPYNEVALQSHRLALNVDLQIEARTVGDFFNTDLHTQVPQEQIRERNNLPPITINGEVKSEKGLAGYLNKLEAEHVRDGKKQIPDMYSFKIDPDIAESKIVTRAIDLSKTANTKDPSKQARQQFKENFHFDETTKSYTIRAGTDLLKIIQNILRSSDFMANQVVSSNLQETSQLPEEYEETQNKPLVFYRVIPEVRIGQFDVRRSAYAKIIIYHIRKFEMTGKDYENFGKKKVEFISKFYDYLYTGNNLDVLGFEIAFNTAFYQHYTYNQARKAKKFPTDLTETSLEKSTHEGQTAKSSGDPIDEWNPYSYEVITNNRTSKDINDPQSDFKSVAVDNIMQDIFDQGADLIQIDLSIIGDMSYIQTKDFYGAVTGFDKHYFLPDGSLNSDKEWHIFIKFRNPEDINSETGLMDGFNVGPDGEVSVNVQSINGYYRVIRVDSSFANGQFSQNLSCIRERNQDTNYIRNSGRVKPFIVRAENLNSKLGARTLGNVAKNGAINANKPQNASTQPDAFEDNGNAQVEPQNIEAQGSEYDNITRIHATYPANQRQGDKENFFEDNT